VDWSTEWFTSIVWILGVTIAAAAGTALVGWLLTRSTVWGRQFRRLAFPYFSPRGPRGVRPLLAALLVLLLTIVSVRISVLVSYANNDIFTALQRLDPAGFARGLGEFGVLATIAVALSLLAYYVQQRLIIRFWEWLTDTVLADWLGDTAYHRGRYTADAVDNPDQRIQEDIASFPVTSLSLLTGAISAVVSLVTFTLILWQLSGPLTVLGFEIPRAMTLIAYVYVILATVVAFRLGRPLIRLNFLNELLRASFRYALVRLRDNSESIAFHRGERVERATLGSRFSAVIANAWSIVFRTLKFNGFNLAVDQSSVVVTLIAQAPRYFAGQVTYGDIAQSSQAFDQVFNSLSFFRNAYDTFAGYRAVLIRLTGLLDADAEARALPSVSLEEGGDGVQVRDLTVRLPDGQVLVDDLDLSLASGASLFVTGPSGSGKTTLLRSMADLWPWAQGTVRRPVGDGALFLSQQPYLPLGSLRTALAYPEPATDVDDGQAAAVLRQVQLPQLVDRLDDETDWSRRLSPGEQQRLGFARVLLTRPRVVFLDEATSALDEGLEHTLYTLLREELPETVIVSVGHRSTLNQFHDERLELLGEGRWQVAALSR
jgi:putative ATP-binding cassette transporter